MSDRMHRRDFLHKAALAGGAAAALPAVSWGRLRGANERLRLGVIGCGPRGMQLAEVLKSRAESRNVHVARVSDVYQLRLTGAAEAMELDTALATLEYRSVIDDPDIDAVVVATPDHWHAKMAVDAMEAGKDVLVETPLSHTIEQAQAVREAVARTGRTFAVAAQRCSSDAFWKMRDGIAVDRIGRVVWSQAGIGINGRMPIFTRPADGRPNSTVGSPEFLWWSRWLGSEFGLAPEIPLDPDRFFRYQKYYDYSNGMAGELLFGMLAPLLLAITGGKGERPRRAVAGGGLYNLFDGRETPDQLMAILDYPREHTIVLSACGTNGDAPRPTIRGRHGTVSIADDGVRFQEEGGFYPEFRRVNKHFVDTEMSKDARGRWIPRPPAGEVGFSMPLDERPDVLDNFVASVRGDARPDCGVELAFAAMVGARLLSDAFRQNKVLLWDEQAGTVTAV